MPDRRVVGHQHLHECRDRLRPQPLRSVAAALVPQRLAEQRRVDAFSFGILRRQAQVQPQLLGEVTEIGTLGYRNEGPEPSANR